MIKKVAGYSAIRAAAEGLLGIRGILLATLLGPAAFGSWALLRLSTRYAALAGLGVFRGLELELLHPHESPTRHGSRPNAGATALGFILVVSGALAATALVASVIVAAPRHQLILRGFAAAVIAEAVYSYSLVSTRVQTTLLRYAMLEASTAALHLLLGVALARAFGLSGAFAALALSSALGAAAASRWVEMRPRLQPAVLSRMLKVGLPVALTGAVGTMLHTADRWVVAAWGGEELLGYYAFAAALVSGAAAVALAIRTVVFPEVYGESRRAGVAAALRGHLERSLLPFGLFLPPVLGLIGLALGPVVELAAPDYGPAIAPARLFLLAGGAVGLVNLAAIGAVAAGHQRVLPLYATSALALNVGLSSAALFSGAGLEGVAAASFAGHLLFAAAVVRLNLLVSGVPEPGRFLFRALRPLVWCAVAVAITGRLTASGVLSEPGAVGIYLLLLLPLAPEWRRAWHRVRA